MTQSQLIGLGGAIGVGGRYLLGLLVGRSLRFPYASFVTNAVGPFLLVVGLRALLRSSLSEEPRVALTTGTLGGFMVLATFNHETMKLIAEGTRGMCVLIMLTAAIGCLLAGGLGFAIARVMG